MNLFKAIGQCWVTKKSKLNKEQLMKFGELSPYEQDMIKVLCGLAIGDNTTAIKASIKKTVIFFTEASVEFSQSLISELQYIQNQITTKELNRVKTIVDICQWDYKDETEKRRVYFDALQDASEAIRNLMNEVENCCLEIRKIDAMSDTEKRYHFKGDLVQRATDRSIRARKCLDVILIGMFWVQRIGAEIGLQNVNSINKEFQNFIDKLLEGSTCLTMHDYDASGGKDEFWLTVPQNAGKLEYLSKYNCLGKDEEQWDFDNIQFC